MMPLGNLPWPLPADGPEQVVSTFSPEKCRVWLTHSDSVSMRYITYSSALWAMF